jgi:peptidyl-tRNA hydrolase
MKRDDFGLGRGKIVQAVADKMSTVEIALVAVRKAVKTPEARELPAHEASTFGGKT